MASEQRFLGEILARRGVVPADKLEALYAVQRERGADLLDLVVNTNVADEMAVARVLAEEAQLPFVEQIDPAEITTALATRVPIAFAKAHRILVVARGRDGGARGVRRSVRHPGARRSARHLRQARGGGRRAVATASRTRSTASTSGRPARSSSRATTTSTEDEAASDILDSDDEAPVIRWVNSLFLQAMKERASDIHIEPEEKEVIVRYRIDGELYVARRAARAFMNSIVSRIKIESSLNIAEKRLPAGRPHHQEDRRQELRHPRQHHPDEPRLRAHRHAPPQQVERPARPARPRASARASTR